MFSFLLYINPFKHLNWKLDNIMSAQAALAETINNLMAQTVKIGGETRSLLDRIAELIEELPDTVLPELQAAVDNLVAQVAIVDELVADPEPEPEPKPITGD